MPPSSESNRTYQHPGEATQEGEADSGDRNPVCASVVIGTLNRRDMLIGVIQSVLEQTFASSETEIIVVDNGSTDGSIELVQEFQESHPLIRLVHESKLGVSAARNRGLKEARGEFVAFIDDDALADPGWLQALIMTFRSEPKAVAVGGPIKVDFAVPPPTWIPDAALGFYGNFQRGSERREIDELFGSNMSFRADVLRALDGFSPQLGRRGSKLLLGEESQVFGRVKRSDMGLILYEPAAKVVHRVNESRIRLRWMLRRAWGSGRTAQKMAIDRKPGRQLECVVRATLNLAVAVGVGLVGLVHAPSLKYAAFRAIRGVYLLGLGAGFAEV